MLDSRRHGKEIVADAERQIRETLHQTGVHVVAITMQASMGRLPSTETDQTQFELRALEPGAAA